MKQLYSYYFPTPRYLAMNSCALDISDLSIKYGELNSKSYGLELGRYGQEKIPAGIIISGKIEDRERLVAILKDIKKRGHLNFVRVSLPEEQMYLFTLSLPLDSLSDLHEAILLQIEEYIPLHAYDTVFDFEVIAKKVDSVLVNVTAISKAIIDSYISVFNEASFLPLSFELEAQAIARSVVPFEEKKTVMIVDFGEARTGVSIASSGRVLFTTTLDIGGVTLTNMIAKNFNISFDQAEKMKRDYGIDSTEGQEDIFPIILNGISVLRDELNKHFLYWNTHKDNKENPIDHIILCGGDANLSSLSEYLETSMKIKVKHANAWVNISDMKVRVPNMSYQESLGYTTVLGLALGDYLHFKSSMINVLPKEEKDKLDTQYILRLTSTILFMMSLLCIIGMVLISPSYLFSKEKEKIANERLSIFNKTLLGSSKIDIDNAIVDVNKKLDILNSVKQTKPVSDTIMYSVLSKKINGIRYTSVFYDEESDGTKSIQITGKAHDRNILKDFKTKLDESGEFTDIDLPISTFLEKSDIDFTVTLKMK